MTTKNLLLKLKELNACREAIQYVSGCKTADEAWENCERGDWMLWLAGSLSGRAWSKKRKILVLASCECARLAWDKMPTKSKDCILLFENWAEGEDISKAELIKVSTAAHADAAAHTAAYAAHADAFDAARASAVATCVATCASADAFDASADAHAAAAHTARAAAAASADTARAARAAAARMKSLAKCADIARKHYPLITDLL